MGFNSAFKGLMNTESEYCQHMQQVWTLPLQTSLVHAPGTILYCSRAAQFVTPGRGPDFLRGGNRFDCRDHPPGARQYY